MDNQMVFKRYEVKYMLSNAQYHLLREKMKEHMISDKYGLVTNLSLYFDTPDNLLIRRSIEKPYYKEKIRVRSYGVAQNDSIIFLELKKKYDSVVYKRRVAMHVYQLEQYLTSGLFPFDTQIMREIDYSMKRYNALNPKMMLSYDREAYYARDNHEFRMTFDKNILWRTNDLSPCSCIYGTPLLTPEEVLLEVKSSNSFPLWLVEFLSQNHIYKTSFSKYGLAYMTNYQQNGGIYSYD